MGDMADLSLYEEYSGSYWRDKSIEITDTLSLLSKSLITLLMCNPPFRCQPPYQGLLNGLVSEISNITGIYDMHVDHAAISMAAQGKLDVKEFVAEAQRLADL